MDFIANTTYQTRFLTDHDSILEVLVTKRTAKTVTFIYNGTEKRAKIHTYEGVEEFFPTGRYSMAPTIRANRYVLPLIEVTELELVA